MFYSLTLAAFALAQAIPPAPHAEEPDRAEILQEIAKLTKAINDGVGVKSDLLFSRADRYVLLGDLGKAFDDFDQSLAVSKSRSPSVLALHQRRDLAMEIGKFAVARADARTLMKVFPDSPSTHAEAAIILARSPEKTDAERSEALAAAQKAEKLDKGKKHTRLIELALAAAHSANGDFGTAVKHMTNAANTWPKDDLPIEIEGQIAAYRAGKEYLFKPKE